MHWIYRVIAHVIINMLALLAAATYIPGFIIDTSLPTLVEVALLFTVLNLLVKPFLELLFGPIILLTLGLGFIVVNAIVLGILDMISKNLTILTVPALLYATLLIGLINAIATSNFKKQ